MILRVFLLGAIVKDGEILRGKPAVQSRIGIHMLAVEILHHPGVNRASDPVPQSS